MQFKAFGGLRTLFRMVVCLFAMASLGLAVDQPVAPTNDAPPPANLATSQEAIEMRYRRFEGTLQQLSEYLRKTDPARAELLVRAIGKSKADGIPDQLLNLTNLLKKDQLGDAVERQEAVVAELRSLLELLMSEARKDEIEIEKKRIQDLLKDVTKLLGKQTDARAETERGGNNSELQSRQKQVTDSAEKLVKKIQTQDAAKKAAKGEKKEAESSDKSKSSDDDAKDGDQSPDSKGKEKPASKNEADKPKSDDDQKKKADKTDKPKSDEKKSKPDSEKPKSDQSDENKAEKKDDGKPSESGDSDKPSESKDSEPNSEKSEQSKKGKPQESKPQKGKPKKGQPQEDQEQQSPQDNQEQKDEQEQSAENEESPQKPDDKTPGREEIQRAKKEMERAIEELKKNNKKGASDKQDKAIAELMKAKEKLEEILRQVREEEREMVLTQMEARFREMLLKQEAVYNATLAVSAVPVDARTDRHRSRAVELARNEEEISIIAAKALTLLKEEGSSVAFPEAIEQIRDDMITISRRLDKADVGEITQNIEQDTIEALKEIIESMQKELEKLKDKRQQQDGDKQQQQQQQKQGLVNKLAEMKMLRSLQFRVNRRTKQLGRLVDGEQALEDDVLNQLKQLSDRQAKVQKATYDLSVGKNQ